MKKQPKVAVQGVAIPWRRGRPKTRPEFIVSQRPRGRPKNYHSTNEGECFT